VVVDATLDAVETETVDETGAAVGGEDLARGRVEGEPAERSRAKGSALDVGKQRHGAGDAVDAPDRAGAAAEAGRSELTRHPLRAGLALADTLRLAEGVGDGDGEAVGGRRGNVDVGLGRVVEGDAEDLPGLRGDDGEGLGHARQLALRPENPHVDDARRRSVKLDPKIVEGIGAFGRRDRDRAGIAGDDELPVIDDLRRLGERRRRQSRDHGRGSKSKRPEEASELFRPRGKTSGRPRRRLRYAHRFLPFRRDRRR
jgi:hypothetical protein